MRLAEAACHAGGHEVSYYQIGGQHFDNYDIEALRMALSGSTNAASNSLTDLQEDEHIEPEVRRILVAHTLAALVLDAVTSTESDDRVTAQQVDVAFKWCVYGEAETAPTIEHDVATITDLTSSGTWNDASPVPLSLFGDLWPLGRPKSWPLLKLSFRPRARIIRTIGDRLISGPEAAVFELVKNSYDADATFVRVTFVPPLELGKGEILVEDDGHGMSKEDIEQKWMEPATSDKRDRRTSSGGRALLGSKGIGRFAAARLGRHLSMTSVAEISSRQQVDAAQATRQSTTIPNIDWDQFENTKYLDDVSFAVETANVSSPAGTTLAISALRDAWSEQQLIKLYQELRRLVSPVHDPAQKSFKIFLDLSKCTPESCGFDGLSLLRKAGGVLALQADDTEDPFEIAPFPILEACDYAVDGIFDEGGRFTGTMTIRRAGLEPEPIDITLPARADEGDQSCGIVLVKLNIFDREAESVRNTARKAGFGNIGVRDARKLLDAIAGVAIYRAGFRLRPYGDGENDWLTLDAKRVQNPSMKIGRNQIAGVVMVDDERESNLIERSSREGLEENGSFRRLQSLILSLLSQVIEPRRRSFRISAGLDTREDATFRDIYQQVQLGWSKSIVAKLPEAERDAAEALVSKETDKLTSYLRRLEDRTAQLEARVTLGMIIGEVMHQGNTPLSFVENEAARLLKWFPTICNGTAESRENLEEVPRILNGMKSSGTLLRMLFNALSPLSGARRGDPKSFEIGAVVRNTLYLFNTKLRSSNIDVFVAPEIEHLRATGYSADLATALTNLIDNAIYWLKHHDVARPEIRITSRNPELGKTVIAIEDNGVGVPDEFLQQVFDVGFSLKPSGTGLGLSIARESISRSGGELSVSDSSEGACFLISLPDVKEGK